MVGGPFLPGVEVGATASEASTYVTVGNMWDDAINFRVADETIVALGDLTATLALPWQTAFNQHNYQNREDRVSLDNLWPSARPVRVPAKQSGVGDDLSWTRPFTQRGSDDIFENQKMLNNLQMIENWAGLGFLAPAIFYVETARTLPEDPESPI